MTASLASALAPSGTLIVSDFLATDELSGTTPFGNKDDKEAQEFAKSHGVHHKHGQSLPSLHIAEKLNREAGFSKKDMQELFGKHLGDVKVDDSFSISKKKLKDLGGESKMVRFLQNMDKEDRYVALVAALLRLSDSSGLLQVTLRDSFGPQNVITCQVIAWLASQARWVRTGRRVGPEGSIAESSGFNCIIPQLYPSTWYNMYANFVSSVCLITLLLSSHFSRFLLSQKFCNFVFSITQRLSKFHLRSNLISLTPARMKSPKSTLSPRFTQI